MVGCVSDREFLAKLDCLRQALNMVFLDAENRNYFASMARMVIGSLLIRAGKDPDTFYASFDEMIRYVNDQSHWAQVLEELESRTVKCFTFYDMVLDFMILDGFDFLDNLPVAVASTLQNRFLPNRIKEATLTSLVLTGLFAKKAILKDMILGFVRDMFSFTRARYTSVEALAEDIVTLAKQRIEKAAEDLSSISSTS